ncbi:hypothetical protein BDV59DRAFT_192865 [Aspergillus ambiguus]|uniref:putative TIM barrel metal-dependent hydrolase n=1 Tax=Aspergillus ambiguus TaxID=176160 RepID=UPI003CCE0AC7
MLMLALIRPRVRRYSKLPPKSWDAHMHVVEPLRFPLAADAVYRPAAHTLEQALAFQSSLGVDRFVLVQPSIYGQDNACLLDALKRAGPARARGVVVIDPATISPDTLASWHSLGVRGVRVNLKSVGKVPSEAELAATLLQHANVIRPLGWVLQIYLSLSMAPALERIMPRLDGIRVCVDHFGGPDLPGGDGPLDPYSLAGFTSLIALLRAGGTYVKISAPYRLSRDGRLQGLEAIVREFLRHAPHRVVYATDWPHTRFAGADIGPFTDMCLRLCARRPGLVERVFRLNAEEMMDGRA